VELDELLSAMDRAEANLAKLEGVWDRASPFIPTAKREAQIPSTTICGGPGMTCRQVCPP
jgi:hypothetical protein